MNRRKFMKTSLAVSTLSGLSGIGGLFAQQVWAADGIADGTAKQFSFDKLKQHAKQQATRPWAGAPGPLPATLANLTPQAYNTIQYDAKHSLWANVPKRQLDVQFFHVGMGFKRPVRMFSLDPATQDAREVHFRPELFNYHDAKVDVSQLRGRTDLGFAGFRAFKAPELARLDILAFLGASYFRAVDDTLQYGLSARGVAVNTLTQHEEFPDFTAFWFETPKSDATRFVVYALLDGASLTGAYKFTITCEEQRTLMNIETSLYPRKDIQQLGIAPMTSMFSCGTNDRRICKTYHPQIHDSDRLAMWTGRGEWICRPLNNPRQIAFSSFGDDNPRGFGLLQLNHNFSDYQDVIGWYDRRPSLWVEPVGSWGKGAINLMEIPTTGETLDNVVCYWQPEVEIKAGSAIDFAYNLYWSAQPPVKSNLANVVATRTGIGGFPEGWTPGEHYPEIWCRRFAVDFTGAQLKEFDQKGLEPVISVDSGTYKQVEILYVQPLDTYRILFDWYPSSDSTKPVNMRMFIRSQGKTLSETWLYQYFPPAANQRNYVDDNEMTTGNS